jgi:thiamine pyrophosphate-dependent acetolactate synthase large subunit-like protein
VVLFDGDGSLMMHIQEMETIKRHGLKMPDHRDERRRVRFRVHKLRSEELPEAGSVFGRPDFAAIARGFGIGGKTIKNLNELPKALEEFTKTGGAAVWDFHVSDKVVSPTIRRSHPGKYKKA